MIKYRRDIDGLRGIAVLAVVGYHAFPATIVGGFVGVDIFFVISGFLISSIILEGLRQDRFSYADFYVRRIRRIFPALVIVLTASLIFGWYALVADEYRDLGKNTAAGAGFISNFAYWLEAGYFDKDRGLKPLLHLWSLGVEEQYYLIWPALLSLLWTRTRNLLPLIGVFLVVSLALNVMFAGSNPDATFYLPDTRFWELMSGSALAYATVCPRETLAAHSSVAPAGPVTPAATIRKVIANGAACAGVLLLAGSMLLINDNNTIFPGWWALMPTAGAFLLIAAGPDTALNRLGLGARPLVFVGLISYPLYLWHWPLLSFANILYAGRPSRAVNIAMVAISFLLAWLTYRAIERPVRMSKSHSTWVTLLVLCFAVGGAGWLVYAHDGFEFRAANQRNSEISRLIADSHRENHAIRARYKLATCDDLAIDARAREACTSYGSPTADSIVLWGDSHSEAWAPVFYSIADESHLRVILFTRGGCPPLVGIRRTDTAGRSVGRCSTFGAAESVVAAIKVIRPKRIFMIARWMGYSDLPFLETAEQSNMKDPQVRHATLQSHLIATLRQLTTAAPVTIFRSVPILHTSAPTGLLRDQPLAPSMAEHREYESSFDRIINAALADVPSVTTFDPAALLCKRTCAVILDGKLLYSDDNHITPQGTLLFKAALLKSEFDVPSAH